MKLWWNSHILILSTHTQNTHLHKANQIFEREKQRERERERERKKKKFDFSRRKANFTRKFVNICMCAYTYSIYVCMYVCMCMYWIFTRYL